ncbi:MAG: SpoIIE family protein phosphatase [Cytophagales bacterium]|nr:SpoIIE family protein phosphatase [Cytophagales bacterium]
MVTINSGKINNLTRKVYIYEDQTGKLGINEILADSIQSKFKKNNNRSPNFDHTTSTIWIKTTIHKEIKEKLYLCVDPVWLDSVHFYTPTAEGIYEDHLSGSALPVETRDLKKINYHFLLNLEKGESKTYYIAIQSQHLIFFHISAGNIESFDYRTHKQDALFFTYIGVLLLLWAYNVFLAIGTKKITNVYYGTYVFFQILTMFYIKGYMVEFLDIPWCAVHSNIFTALMMIFLVLSITHFSKIKQFSKILYYFHFILIFACTSSIILNILDFVLISNVMVVNLSFFGGVWGACIAIVLLRKKANISNLLMLIGFIFFMLGGILHVLLIKGFMPSNLFTNSLFMLGSGLEVIFLSTSFSLSIQKMQRDKYRAQKELLTATRKNEQLEKERANKLEEEVAERTKDLENKHKELERSFFQVKMQKKIIETKNKHINDSIRYAQNIQNALLPPHKMIQRLFSEFSILYRPKDILSGDIYFVAEKNGWHIAAAIDCTGHGVPGALMSMTVHGILQQIIFEKGITSPERILNYLHTGIRYSLKQDYNNSNDGLDIALISFNPTENKLLYSGAKNPLIYIQNEELHEVKGDRVSVGGVNEGKERNYTLHTLDITEPTQLFLFSDGYQDQFGKNEKKFMKKNFKKELLKVSPLSSAQQAEDLLKTLEEWSEGVEQIDDILVFGIKIKPQ